MAQIPKIESILFPKLNNSEYIYLLTQILELLARANPTNLGLSEEFFLELKAHVEKMVAISAGATSSEHTALLHSLDTKRKDLLLHVLSSIRTACKVEIPNVKQSANALYLSTKQYTGIQTLPHNQETQEIFYLQKDLEESEAAAHVNTLGLTRFVAELFKTNQDYFEHAKERMVDSAEKDLGSCHDVRLITDEQYRYLSSMAVASILMKPTPEAIQFVESLNILIKETKTAYKQRTAQHKSNSLEDEEVITEELTEDKVITPKA